MRIIFFILFLITCSCTKAQEPVHRTINNINSLPSNTVYQVLQDSLGFIWIAHDKGLSKYDGSNFKHFRSPSQQGSSLSNLHSFNSTIWCQDFAGNFYYTKENALYKEQQLKSSGSYTASARLKEYIIAFTEDSVCLINGFNHNKHSWKLPLENFTYIGSGNKDAFLFAEGKLYTFNHEGLQLKQHFKNFNTQFFFLQQMNDAIYGFTKNIYPYVFLLKNNQATPLHILQEGLIIQDISFFDNEIWISTTTGAYCFNKDWQPLYNGHCFFKANSISKVIKDREGSYWFATLNNGIMVVPDLQIELYHYNNESITTLAHAGANIIAGTSNHRIVQFNIKNGSFSNIYQEPSNHAMLGLLYHEATKETVFWSNKIGYVKEGNKHKEINNYAAKSIVPVTANFYAVATSTSISLIRRNKSNTPVPSWLQTKQNTWNNHKYNLLDSIIRGRFVLFNQSDSTLYASTTKGLFYFSPKGKGKITYNGKDIFASQLAIAHTGIYVTTYADGLYKIKNNNEAEHIVHKEITPSLYKITASGNYLWLISDDMLLRYNTIDHTVVNYTHAKGLPKAELNDVLIKEGKVYLATTQGIVVLNENLNVENKVAPLLTINSLWVNGQSINIKQQPLQLRSHQNNIVVHFSLLSYKSGENAGVVQYRINKGDWQTLESSARQLSLPSLSSGKYIITIRAFNEDNVASEKDIHISFSITAPFFKQWWFIGCILLAIASFLWAFFLYRIKNIQQRNKLVEQKMKIEHELNQSMLSAIKSQMNPHFLFNALNTIQSYIYTNDKENASEYLSKFSQLTRLILDMSNKDFVSMADEIKALKLYLELEQQRFEDKLQYIFHIDDNINTETLYIPTMLIQPYVENAIKHGLLHKKNDRKLNISFQKQEGGILVNIEDNGIGRKRSEQLNKHKQKHQSFALKANEKRLEILNRGLKQSIALQIIDKEDKHGNALGTLVKLFIPTQSRTILV